MPAAPPSDVVRPACRLLAAYLALSLIPLALAATRRDATGAYDVATVVTLATHVVLLVLAAVLGLRRVRVERGMAARALGAWLPLLSIPLLYGEMPRVAAGIAGRMPAPMHDATIIGWERPLFAWLGGSPAVMLAVHWPWTALSALLHAGYLSYYALIYLPPTLLWASAMRAPAPMPNDIDDLRTTAERAVATPAFDPFGASVFAVLLAFVVCYVVFALFPVQGPWYTWPSPPAVPPNAVRDAVLHLLGAGSSRGTAFPSSHVAVSVAQTTALAQVAPRMAPLAALSTVLLALGAMYGGFHYGVDVAVGAVVGLAVGTAGPRLWRRMSRRAAA